MFVRCSCRIITARRIKLPSKPAGAVSGKNQGSHRCYVPFAVIAFIRYIARMQVLYFDECKWQDVGDGLIFHYTDPEGECLAEIALKDSDSQLWKFEVMLPDRYRLNETNPAGLVFGQTGARRVVETILLNTIVTR